MIKTIAMTGTEITVTGLDGAYAHIRNDGADIIYAAKITDVTAGADGVLSIPAGQAATLTSISGTIYLLGVGSVLIQSDDYASNPFKTSTVSGGSAVDEVARAAVNAHTENAEIHVTAEEKADWNAVNYINPSLLDNGWFGNGVINQRGNTSYSGANVYTVDRWYTGGANVTVDDGYLIIAPPNATTTASLRQKISRGAKLSGKTITASVDCDLTTDGSRITLQILVNGAWTTAVYETQTGRRTITRTFTLPDEITTDTQFVIMLSTPATAGVVTQLKLYSAKIELGSAATQIIPPDPAQELAKCQRYYQIRSTNDIAAVDLRPTMRVAPTDITAVTGGYAYVAEL